MQSSDERSNTTMKKQSFGAMIAAMRKEQGMTQLELAEKMGVTDKAVSKWERDLSFPDVNSIPRLAEIFDVTVDEIMQVKSDSKENGKVNRISEMVLKGIPLAMGIDVVVLSLIDIIEARDAVIMLGIGLAWLVWRLHIFQKRLNSLLPSSSFPTATLYCSGSTFKNRA